MAVWHDRHEGVFHMGDRDGGRRESCDDTAQQYGVRRQTADTATIQAKHGSRRGHSRTQQIHYRDYQDRDVYLDDGFPGETLSGLRPYLRAVAGKVWLNSGAKEGLQAKSGSVDGRVRGVKAPFFVQQGLLGSIQQENSR